MFYNEPTQKIDTTIALENKAIVYKYTQIKEITCFQDLFQINRGTGEVSLSYTIDDTITSDLILLTIQVKDKGMIPKTR